MSKSNTLTDFEKQWIEWFRSYHQTVQDPLKKRKIQEVNKEKTWIQIYTKLPIEPHVESLLFRSTVDEYSIVSEMEQYIESHFS